ncbi:ImmA/IrrE family metallo-endopeptidase [Chryseobacterium sp. KCF3-3]|uniref:ImmA/IrrE family metallo-endopeptidase n=1 Tax=Chryseobacterium sp. KCF3-3 TaxID=3231511 RepID=UPI0038B33286
MINNTPLVHIKELAEYIAQDFKERIIPVDKIAINEGLELIYYPYEKGTFDGMTVYSNKKFYIHLNTDSGNERDSKRGRFTLAHELGHYFIDTHRIGLKSGLLAPHPSTTNIKQFNSIEREADYFASCLLMPEVKFKEDIFRKKFSFDLIQNLAFNYNVSITACAFRFAQIGNHPIMIIYSENGFIKWKTESDDFPYKWLLNDKKVPENTVMGEYFTKTNVRDIFKTEQVWAMDWFYYVKEEDVNRRFYEHCIPYKGKALSIIWED